MLANDRTASAMDMISRVKFKILSPLFQVKHKAGLVIESICKWLGAALAVGFHKEEKLIVQYLSYLSYLSYFCV